jgi:predicted GNAT family acetyltransferase
VADNPADERFEVYVGGTLAGAAYYQLSGDQIVFTHTEIAPAFEGQGLGGRLAAAALDTVRRRGLGVIALCPFIAGFIARHPEYADLLVQGAHPGGNRSD